MDGKVLYFGEVDSAYNMEQVKGVHYSLVSFCGPKHPLVRELIKQKEKARQPRNQEHTEGRSIAVASSNSSEGSNTEHSSLKDGGLDLTNSKLYYCLMYLAPGDYHWFHSPTDWTIEHRRHIPGIV